MQSDTGRFVERASAMPLPAACRDIVVSEHRTLEDSTKTEVESYTLEVDPACRDQWFDALEERQDFLCPDDLENEHFADGAAMDLCMKDSAAGSVWVTFRDQSTVEFAVVTPK